MIVDRRKYQRTKYACWYAYVSMSSVFSLPPMLFLTFRNMYGISYTLLGTLVLLNFCTQLTVDLIFSFFAKYFNVRKTVQLMPLLTAAGLLTYAVVPMLLPQHAYVGLVIGTVLFSIAAGLCETLISPLLAALPLENPEREMSKLHSLFAYGVLGVVVISTVFFKLFGVENWMYLTMFLALLPIFASVFFSLSPIPDINVSHNAAESGRAGKNRGLFLCVLCIFLGSAAENTMTNWVSGYLENVLQISKIWSDLLGLAAFAVLLGLGRTLYGKYGKNISGVLLWSMIGATACYLIAGFSNNVVISMIACMFTGFCTSMLWPGTLILMEEKFPAAGVTAYALMAAGGDFGGSIAPQLMGIVVDTVAASDWAQTLSTQLSMAPDQIGMKVGMLIAAVFPLLGVALLVYMKKYFSKKTV